MSVRLSEDEAWAYLERGHTGILTSLRRDGMPIALPVWYAVLDRAIFVGGPSHTKKFARIRHDDRVSFLVESGLKWEELEAVQVNGRADILEDAELAERVEAQFDAKYAAYRPKRRRMPEATRKHYSGRALIRIRPEGRWLTWNNAKIPLSED